jgi:hypothetical protein
MKTLCAWCGYVMAEGSSAGPVSHGICGPCAAIVLGEMEGADAASTRPGEMNLKHTERLEVR